jgi:hypothetical protein
VIVAHHWTQLSMMVGEGECVLWSAIVNKSDGNEQSQRSTLSRLYLHVSRVADRKQSYGAIMFR